MCWSLGRDVEGDRGGSRQIWPLRFLDLDFVIRHPLRQTICIGKIDHLLADGQRQCCW